MAFNPTLAFSALSIETFSPTIWLSLFPMESEKHPMVERGITVDHSTLSRWVHRLVPLIVKRYCRNKSAVGHRWRMDETYIKVKGQ
ncbi:transposase [Xenorhabdus doucetiae]|uniref:Transposase n=1 Tax=Xenorhabdus doucetiae TaxID=351671 RepID=A0A068QN38_9GAMM|nr:hypothetical protein LY16_01908 [Xenorhabdus doucetiae]CDG16362.1 transposase [Xenorhabdus doucetiae]